MGRIGTVGGTRTPTSVVGCAGSFGKMEHVASGPHVFFGMNAKFADRLGTTPRPANSTPPPPSGPSTEGDVSICCVSPPSVNIPCNHSDSCDANPTVSPEYNEGSKNNNSTGIVGSECVNISASNPQVSPTDTPQEPGVTPFFKEIPHGIENQFVNISKLTKELKRHPDEDRVERVLHGLKHGYDIGFRGEFKETFPKNNASAFRHKHLLSASVDKEVARQHTAGPFLHPPFVRNHISPLGADIKPDGTARLIMDLSQPKGESINEHISKEDFPTNYVHFDVATTLVRKMGRGCLLSKIDIKHAFRLLPVRPEDWPLLVYYWEGHYYVDLKLPFGARSSPSIFTDFADLLCWILTTNYKLVVIHYADDYLLFPQVI